ncbi:hypothetical protein C5615_32370 [Burkholderia cepacia]|uniref:Uncharacterized protein n=1 Tax=Burkholderia cepacia TaxID=292 RepID=A0A2S8I9Y4_BURCE|nr:hypothetical protein JM78_21175 [Burkholderia pyrrocinia]PQP11172.1 hypothetical protein C5615_32370 [Burkholderia cepacia]
MLIHFAPSAIVDDVQWVLIRCVAIARRVIDLMSRALTFNASCHVTTLFTDRAVLQRIVEFLEPTNGSSAFANRLNSQVASILLRAHIGELVEVMMED